MTDQSVNVLYVDDELNNLNSFQSMFRDEFKVYVALSGEQGLNILRNNLIHIIISDQVMSEMNGIAFLAEARKINSMAIRILLSGIPDAKIYKEALNKVQLFRILDKPFVYEEIKTAIKEGYELFEYRQAGKDYINKLIEANEKLLNFHDQKLTNAKLIIDSYESKN